MNLPIMAMMAYWCYKSFGLAGVLGFPCAMLAMLYFRQNGMLYVNSMKSYQMLPDNPHFNLAYEEVKFLTADGFSICSWLIKQPHLTKGRNVAPTLIFFHGNAGTIAERLPNADGLVKKCGCNVLLVEYRGYGTSEGSPTEAGLLADAQAALEMLLKRTDIDTDNLYVFGRSLGGAVAIALAQANPGKLRAMIVENTFTSIREMAGSLFPFLKLLPQNLCEALLENHWHSDSIIHELKLPILFLGGKQDEIVPTAHMSTLWDLYTAKGTPSGATQVFFPTGKHNDTWTLPGYYDYIVKFIRDTGNESSSSSSGGSSAKGDGAKESDLGDGWEKMEKPVNAMSVGELKSALRKRNIDASKCVEKSEMQKLLEQETAASELS
eukprot:COSAG05_NODE_261_length_12717_cov_4.824061_2_plen_380_part_00